MKSSLVYLVTVIMFFGITEAVAQDSTSKDAGILPAYRLHLSNFNTPAFAGDNGRHIVQGSLDYYSFNSATTLDRFQLRYQTTARGKHGFLGDYTYHESGIVVTQEAALGYAYKHPLRIGSFKAWIMAGARIGLGMKEWNFDNTIWFDQLSSSGKVSATTTEPKPGGTKYYVTQSMGFAIRHDRWYASYSMFNLNEPVIAVYGQNSRLAHHHNVLVREDQLHAGVSAFRAGQLQVGLIADALIRTTNSTMLPGLQVMVRNQWLAVWQTDSQRHLFRAGYYSDRIRLQAQFFHSPFLHDSFISSGIWSVNLGIGLTQQ